MTRAPERQAQRAAPNPYAADRFAGAGKAMASTSAKSPATGNTGSARHSSNTAAIASASAWRSAAMYAGVKQAKTSSTLQTLIQSV
mgnify:FL=1